MSKNDLNSTKMESAAPRKAAWRRALQRSMAAASALAVGISLMAATPAMADHKHDKWKHHHKHAKHGHGNGHHNGGTRVVYVQPRPIYIEEPTYYVVPAPRHHPRPVVYEAPSINIVVPLFD